MRTRIQGSPRSRLAVTRLEDRTVPAVTASLVNGILTILGDGAANAITITAGNGQINVANVGMYSAASVRAITVDAGDGDDTITVGNSVTTPAVLFGGYGNDRITAGGGNTQVFGGLGNDVLTAGSGHATMYGGAGSNSLSDPFGTSTLNQGSPNVTSTMNEMEAQIFALLNQQRAANGLSALTVDPRLVAAAQLHSQNMADLSLVVGMSEALSHTLMGSPEPSVTTRADYVGFDYRIIGENIAFGYQDANAVMTAWMNSAGHRANILYSAYTSVGVGVRYNSAGVAYYTQEFGTPATTYSNPPPSQPPPSQPPASQPPSNPPAPANPSQHLVVMGAGQGGGPQVVAFNPTTGQQVFNFMAFASNFRGGVTVAAGDVNGDGYDDLVVAAGQGGGPHVKIFNGRTGQLIREFMAYETSFRGGVYLAVGDVNGDGKADVITGTGVGGGPLVKVWDGATGAMLSSYYAYASAFRGGVTVAAGDVNGDGKDDIVVGTGVGGNSTIHVYDGGTFAMLQGFSMQSSNLVGGVRVAAMDLDGDGKADLLVSGGRGSAAAAYGYNGQTLSNLRTFTAFDPSFLGGVYVG
jgi:uncharacterized protein YkwD